MVYVCFYLLANVFMVYGYYCFFNVYFDRSQVSRRQEFLFYSIFFCADQRLLSAGPNASGHHTLQPAFPFAHRKPVSGMYAV